MDFEGLLSEKILETATSFSIQYIVNGQATITHKYMNKFCEIYS